MFKTLHHQHRSVSCSEASLLYRMFYLLVLLGLRDDKVSTVDHTYPHKLLMKTEVAICNHQVDSPFYLWPNVCSGDLHAKEKTIAIHDTECPYWDQVSLNNTDSLCSFLTLKVLNFWKFTSCCSLKPLWSGMREVVPARTSPTLHPLPLCINCCD